MARKFLQPLKRKHGSNDLYVTDRNGKKMTATSLGNTGKTLYVKGLVPGSTTSREKNAVNGKL